MPKSVSQLVEEQIIRWQKERARQTQADRPPRKHERANVITMSDEFGAGGTAVCKLLGEQLGMPIYNREIVAHIASSERIRLETVELLDERALGYVDNYLTALWHEKNFDRSDYSRALSHTITALWGHGPALFVGHGAVHIVPRQHSLAVRLTAPEVVRVSRVAEAQGLDRGEAARKVRQKDLEREAFIRRLFSANIHDPQIYDVMLNTLWLQPEACAGIIMEAWRRKFPR